MQDRGGDDDNGGRCGCEPSRAAARDGRDGKERDCDREGHRGRIVEEEERREDAGERAGRVAAKEAQRSDVLR
jgi:hypothetical protein